MIFNGFDVTFTYNFYLFAAIQPLDRFSAVLPGIDTEPLVLWYRGSSAVAAPCPRPARHRRFPILQRISRLLSGSWIIGSVSLRTQQTLACPTEKLGPPCRKRSYVNLLHATNYIILAA